MKRQVCFAAESDYGNSLQELMGASARHECAHGYVTMTNHAHLLVTLQSHVAASRMMQAIGRPYVGPRTPRARISARRPVSAARTTGSYSALRAHFPIRRTANPCATVSAYGDIVFRGQIEKLAQQAAPVRPRGRPPKAKPPC